MIRASASKLQAIEDRAGMLPSAIFPRNVRSYLLTIVIVAIAVVGAFGGAVVFWATSRQAEMADAEMIRTAKAFAIALDQELGKTTSSLEDLAAVLADDGDFARFHRIATAARERHSFWSQVTLRDEYGQPLLTTAVPFGAEFPRSGTYSDIVGRVLATGEPEVTNLMFGPIAQMPVVGVFVPARDDRGRRYVISAAVSGSAWTRFLQQQYVPAGWFAGIIDGAGTVMARTRAPDQFVGRPVPSWVGDAIKMAEAGSASGPSLEGDELALVFARSKVASWTLTFAAPASLLRDHMQQSLWFAGAANSFVLFSVAAVVLLFARKLSAGISGLRDLARVTGTPTRLGKDPLRPKIFELAKLYDSIQAGKRDRCRSDQHHVTQMRELQHRVKNDLQALRSLLQIEACQTESAETQAVLKGLDGRIEALRLVHARLYESEAVGTVELGGYLRELCANAASLHGGRLAGGITVTSRTAEISVSHDAAVAMGLIANEFVTNSAKHAFPDGHGAIMLQLDVSPEGEISLSLSDDGIGMPAKRTRSSGLMLIEMLAQQVGGKATWRAGQGTHLCLTVPAQDYSMAAE